MKSKTSILILVSIVAFLALSTIQAYLVYNTYTLKRNAFLSHIKNEISPISNNMTLDSISNMALDYLQNQLRAYKSGEISKQKAIATSRRKIESLNSLYKKVYKNLLADRQLEYALKYQKVLKSAVILGTENDTLFLQNKSKPFLIFGDNFSLDKAHTISVSRNLSQINYEDVKRGEEKTLSIELKFSDYVKIIDEKSIVFKQMIGILLGAFFIFLIVVYLFYYSLKSLLKQRKINTIKTEFINNITHELKTPLTTLNIGTKSLRKKTILEDPNSFNATLDTIDRQNQRLQKLIDQVIYKSVKAGDLQLKLEKTELKSYLLKIVEDYKIGITNQNVKLSTSFSEEKFQIDLDQFHFSTALLNLLDNAVKYNEGEKIIYLSVSVKIKEIQISVKDNGIGIPKKELSQIFDKFYRISDGDVHANKSLGLGLFYTHQIIKAHHGAIQVKSKPGKGSLFLIKLPLNDA